MNQAALGSSCTIPQKRAACGGADPLAMAHFGDGEYFDEGNTTKRNSWLWLTLVMESTLMVGRP